MFEPARRFFVGLQRNQKAYDWVRRKVFFEGRGLHEQNSMKEE